MKKANLDQVVFLRVSSKLKTKIEHLAEEEGLALAAFIRRLIIQSIKTNKN